MRCSALGVFAVLGRLNHALVWLGARHHRFQLSAPLKKHTRMKGSRVNPLHGFLGVMCTALEGRQDAEWDNYSASWGYHPDSGLDIVVEINDEN